MDTDIWATKHWTFEQVLEKNEAAAVLEPKKKGCMGLCVWAALCGTAADWGSEWHGPASADRERCVLSHLPCQRSQYEGLLLRSVQSGQPHFV